MAINALQSFEHTCFQTCTTQEITVLNTSSTKFYFPVGRKTSQNFQEIRLILLYYLFISIETGAPCLWCFCVNSAERLTFLPKEGKLNWTKQKHLSAFSSIICLLCCCCCLFCSVLVWFGGACLLLLFLFFLNRVTNSLGSWGCPCNLFMILPLRPKDNRYTLPHPLLSSKE